MKVETTAEQQEEKRKRQKKLKLFQTLLGIAFKKIRFIDFQ